MAAGWLYGVGRIFRVSDCFIKHLAQSVGILYLIGTEALAIQEEAWCATDAILLTNLLVVGDFAVDFIAGDVLSQLVGIQAELLRVAGKELIAFTAGYTQPRAVGAKQLVVHSPLFTLQSR